MFQVVTPGSQVDESKRYVGRIKHYNIDMKKLENVSYSSKYCYNIHSSVLKNLQHTAGQLSGKLPSLCYFSFNAVAHISPKWHLQKL